MKIGLVFDGSLDSADGVAQYVLMLGHWLAAQGHEVHYVVGETKRIDLPRLHSLSRNLTVNFNQNRMSTPLPASKRRIRTLLENEQFDVLHIQMPYSPFMAGRVIRAAGPQTAVMGTFHVLPASRFVYAGNRVLGLLTRGSLRRFDAVISNTKPTHDFARRAYGIKSDIIPLGLNLEPFFEAKPFTAYKNTKTVVFLGRLVERKGCQYLLEAVAKLVRENRWPENGKVIVCGAGQLQLRLTQFVHENGLTDIVDFKGFISEQDKPRFLASADVAIYPSTGGESFGIVLLEAMAAARGVVLGGNNLGYAAVMHEHPESLFNPKDTDKLADTIALLLEDTAARQHAHAWQQTYVKQFDITKTGPRTVALYEQALRKRRK